MSDSKSFDRKRKKGFFHQKGEKKGKQSGSGFVKKKYELQAGMVGFLATLNDKQEKQAISELLNILPDFLPGEESSQAAGPSDGLAKGGDDIAAMLAAENPTANLLQFCDTRVPNIVFIRLPPEQTKKADLNSVVHKVYESLENSGKTPRHITRYVLRLVPVTASCPAHIDRINKSLREALESYIASLTPGELESSYANFNLCFRSTYNQSIKSQEIEDILICHMASLASSIRLSRTARERVLVIGVHILKSVCCISFLRDYYKFAKYNLSEFQAKQIMEKAESDNEEEQKTLKKCSKEEKN